MTNRLIETTRMLHTYQGIRSQAYLNSRFVANSKTEQNIVADFTEHLYNHTKYRKFDV